MRKVQKGFTLVELIVVITILAILGTIAFISLQGYSQDAKNSKITSDIRTLVSAVETSLTDGSVNMGQLVTGDLSATNAVTGTYASGATLGGSGTYAIGTVNFAGLRQNGSDFQDNEGNDYIISTAVLDSDNAFYQIAGQTDNADGVTFTAVSKGNYVQIIGTDATGLIAENGWSTGVTDGLNLTTGLY